MTQEQYTIPGSGRRQWYTESFPQ